ncbi:hypothetical protein NMD15_03705 [Plesiomonas shigelloides]|uniref:hypothetical protein n=1 Tax=Plesiomonas shigelloides TaxID=703 RepID=UPI00351D454F
MISFPVFPAVPRPLSGFFVSVAGDYRYVPHGGVFILSYLLSLISYLLSLISYLLSLISYLLSLVPLLIGFGRFCAVLFSSLHDEFAGGRALPFLPLGGGAIAAKD